MPKDVKYGRWEAENMERALEAVRNYPNVYIIIQAYFTIKRKTVIHTGMYLITILCFWQPFQLLNDIILQNKHYCMYKRLFPCTLFMIHSWEQCAPFMDHIAMNGHIIMLNKTCFSNSYQWVTFAKFSLRKQSKVFICAIRSFIVVDNHYRVHWRQLYTKSCCTANSMATTPP